MPTTDLSFHTRWSRHKVLDTGGATDLLIRITAPQLPTRGSTRTPLDVAFVIDRSGSMAGPQIEEAKNGVRVALDHLDQRDQAAVVIYDDRIDLLHPLSPVSASVRRQIDQSLNFVDARGSTNLGEGWLAGCREIAADTQARRLRRAILLTDGHANVGMVDAAQLAQHAGQLRARGVTTTTLGFGQGFDEQLLSAMAEAGGGNFEFIRTPDQLVSFFTRELGDLLNAAAIGLTLHITLPEGVHGEVISVLPNERHGKTFEVTIGDIPAGESIDVLMHLKTGRGTRGDQLPVRIAAEWSDPINDREATWHGEPTTLVRATQSVIASLADDPDVAEKVALQRAANAQRASLRLDREGRFAESREQMEDIVSYLELAPQTERIVQEAQFIQTMASAPKDRMFDETTHKRTASRASRMGRGRRDRAENLTEE